MRRHRDEYDDDRFDRGRARQKSGEGSGFWIIIVSVSIGVSVVLFLPLCIVMGLIALGVQAERKALKQFAEQAEQPRPNQPPVDAGDAGGGATKVYGGAFDPEFRDEAPDGGLLIGMELGLLNNNSIKTIRPIYRVGNQEIMGQAHGQIRQEIKVVTVKAKTDYAIGRVTVNAGLWIDGMSVTFMRVKDGRLDAVDAYESEYLGGLGGNRTNLGGTGAPVIGVLGKSNGANDCTGFGILLRK